MTTPNTFGAYLRARRTDKQIGLRVFAERIDMKPSNLSNVECSRINPPQDVAVLDRIAAEIEATEEERARLYDLAVQHRDNVPAPDVARYAAETAGVPVLLRTMADRGLTHEQIEELRGEIEARYPSVDH